jgi:predicted SnoaL-like aldol condensation-catalyzing enzyme
VADVIVYLASDKARWITGASIPLDGDRRFSSLSVSVIKPTDQWEEADMSSIKAIDSSAEEDRTSAPRTEEILSHGETLGDSVVADGTRQNDIRLRAYEIYVQREQQPDRAIDDWLQAEREWNKALVLQAFDTLFNKHDYAAAERFWSPDYIQHSAHIEPGREGLFNLIKSLPSTLKYEPGTIVAEGDFVIVHGRFSGFGQPVNWIAADVVRIQDGVLAEHWDVIQDEATRQESKSGLPMFGDSFSK